MPSVLVTGAARGIGKSFVKHLASRGWDVIAGVRSEQDADAVTKLHPQPMSLTAHDRWGTFYARERLAPMAERAAPLLNTAVREDVESAISRCEAGDFDDDDAPARLHGDLWSGNVMWTPDGVVLIDPAAHGGHRETDLAMLALFGCPFLDAAIEGYQAHRPLRDGWRTRIGLHQLYPLLAHVALFGGGYASQTRAAAQSVLRIS